MLFCVTLLILYSFMESQSERLRVFGPDAPLAAVAGKDLVLPCFIKPSTSAVDMTVQWFRLDVEDSLVHLYEDHEDRNEDQAQTYRRRTSLFKEELQKGNASLKLSALRVSDEGEYKCLVEDKSWSDGIIIYVTVEGKVFDTWKWGVTISVSACLIAFGWIVTAVILHKTEPQRQKVEHELTEKKIFAELQRQRMKHVLAEKKKFAVDVTLDPDTAHPKLILSADGKQVKDGDIRQDLPDTPQRFDYYPFVVGKQSFSSGRFYYEVQVRGKTKWILGVMREDSNRKGSITLTPQNGFWTVRLWNENQYWANAGPDVPLTLREKVEKVGVFVDYEEGLVSFYDVKSSSHIYSFTAQSFTEKLYPFFSPCLNEGGKNSAPLIISPVFNTE
ncbi:erythroid membrane-associated protein-like isoform X2 [Pangasianodon hypophthalmus]|uniref:erythroid membrane-associated protein-like isoform X2 n=1 Tax=Pangasianodon hypophthalmus TaxID=310915 RepID=UPI002307D3DD|nr:erythroid membrane-associated protein-like isoform X2 [Pangasianodon hypophthalmus]